MNNRIRTRRIIRVSDGESDDDVIKTRSNTQRKILRVSDSDRVRTRRIIRVSDGESDDDVIKTRSKTRRKILRVSDSDDSSVESNSIESLNSIQKEYRELIATADSGEDYSDGVTNSISSKDSESDEECNEANSVEVVEDDEITAEENSYESYEESSESSEDTVEKKIKQEEHIKHIIGHLNLTMEECMTCCEVRNLWEFPCYPIPHHLMCLECIKKDCRETCIMCRTYILKTL
jgi:hypothetical protein